MWEELAGGLDHDVETAWCLTARLVDADDGAGSVTLVARQLVLVKKEFYASRLPDRLDIMSGGWVPTFGTADTDGSVPIFIHTHPSQGPRASTFDAIVDTQLSSVAVVRTRAGAYASLVLGGDIDRPTFTGRLYRPKHGWADLTHLRVAGDRLRLLAASNGLEQSPQLPMFDRQVRAFGPEGQELLRLLRVGVIGAGGTGSAVIEQLIRLGVAEIIVLDPQRLTESNVTRVYGSGVTDLGALKVNLAERQAERIGIGTTVVGIPKDCADIQGAHALAHCDILFGCTDDNVGRTVLTRFPAHLLQHLIDCAVVIDSRDEVLFDVFGRLSIVTPGSPCLLCMKDVDQNRALAETLSRDEYNSQRAEGYAPDLDTPDPAVVTYTSAIASAAVSEMLQRMFHLGSQDAPNRLLHRFISRSVSRTNRQAAPSHWCQLESTRGDSTATRFLGRAWTTPS
jgi:molybdopterin/thiamine biosynthesis adenylyltransferase